VTGTIYLADTSAYAVSLRSALARGTIQQLAGDGDLATFVTIDLELGYSAKSPAEHQQIFVARAGLVQLAFVDDIAVRAREVQALMAATSQHRAAGIVDLLTAAAAEFYDCTVLHYDGDFDHIARVTGQPTTWIVPAGSV
jgi:predicted nucleic acid-binding protein